MKPSFCSSRPQRVDHRNKVGPIRDQGARPTCLSFATSAAHEIKRASTPLAPEALYRFALIHDGAWCGGISIRGITSALEADGQCFEIDWPYGALEPVNSKTEFFRSQSVLIADSPLEFTLEALAAGKSLVVAIAITSAWFDVSDNGQIQCVDTNEPALGHHAVVAIGYDETDRQLLIRNSWGEGWGSGGYGHLPYEVFAARVLTVFALE